MSEVDDTANNGLDEVTKSIVRELQRDGRASYAEVARAVGLSETAVRTRVQRLLNDGTVQIVAVTDPLRLGFTRQALIGLRITGDLAAVRDALLAMPEVSYLVTTVGTVDLLAEVVCADDDQLTDLITRRIRTLPGVTSTETHLYLQLNKQTYDWGTR